MKGAILEKGEDYYTNLGRIFAAINNIQKNYNWLVTDFECCNQTVSFDEFIYMDRNYPYMWLSGDELTSLIEAEEFQWVWAVLSGFDKNISREEVIKYEMPYADGYRGFWKNPVSIQHPLADMEIVPWDSSLVLFISRDNTAADNFRRTFPLSRDLREYNETGQQPDESAELEEWLRKR